MEYPEYRSSSDNIPSDHDFVGLKFNTLGVDRGFTVDIQNGPPMAAIDIWELIQMEVDTIQENSFDTISSMILMNTGNLLHENTRLDLLFNFATKTYAASRICIRSLNLQQARSLHNHVGNVCSWLSVIAQNDPSRLIGKNFLYELKDDSKKWDMDIFLIPATPRTLFETPDNWNAVSGVIMFRRLCMVYIALNEWIQELSDFDGKIEPCCHLFNFIKTSWLL